MQPILFILAALALIGSAVACDWQDIDGASIEIKAIPGGFRALVTCPAIANFGKEMKEDDSL